MEQEDKTETFIEPKLEFVSDYSVRFLYDWSYKGYLIPQGFVTDGASVPRVLWNIIPPLGPIRYAAFLHDFGYQHGYLLVEATVDYSMPPEDYKFYMNWKSLFINYYPVHCTGGRSFFDNLFYKIFRERRMIQSWIAIAGLKLWGWKVWNTYRKRGPAAYNNNSLHLPGI